jgi:hypothetical protein
MEMGSYEGNEADLGIIIPHLVYMHGAKRDPSEHVQVRECESAVYAVQEIMSMLFDDDGDQRRAQLINDAKVGSTTRQSSAVVPFGPVNATESWMDKMPCGLPLSFRLYTYDC